MGTRRRHSTYQAEQPDGLARGVIALSLFAALVALTGGSSRSDITQIIALRSFSALFLVAALYQISWRELKLNGFLSIALLSYGVLLAIQVAPMPPEVWRSLPGRADIYLLDAALDMEGLWRPLTFTPTRTWNALGSFIVPVCGFLLVLAYRASTLTLLRLVGVLGVFNAALGLAQIVAGKSSVLYFYAITSRGAPVGIFANENHSAVFAACSLLIVAALGVMRQGNGSPTWERLLYPAAFFLILLVSLAGGSRAGFVAVMGAVFLSIVVVVIGSGRRGGRAPRDPVLRWIDGHLRLLVACAILIALIIPVGFVALGRAPAFVDILAKDNFADLRWSLWPVILEMLKTHWLVGTGFGSFEQVYHIYEPTSLLMPKYVNQAHNDWVQLVIEGGVLGAALVLSLIGWAAKQIFVLAAHRAGRTMALVFGGVFLILGFASIIDYPLRTPVLQLVLVWLLLALSNEANDIRSTLFDQGRDKSS